MCAIRNWKVAAPLKGGYYFFPVWQFGLQSATEKLRLHWRLMTSNAAETVKATTIRNWKVAAPLKVKGMFLVCDQLSPIRNWKVAAPLKDQKPGELIMWKFINPQLKSCGSIEGRRLQNILLHLIQQSATEKLRLHWRLNKFWIISWIWSAIRNWKVAAPLKDRRIGELSGGQQQQSATEKLRLHWRNARLILYEVGKSQSATEKLRLHWRMGKQWDKALAPVQSATEKLRLHWRSNIVYTTRKWITCNPQLKSCGSIEGQSIKSRIQSYNRAIRNWKVAAPLKESWVSTIRSPSHNNPQLKSCGSIEGIKSKLPLERDYFSIRNWKVAAPLKVCNLPNNTCIFEQAIRNWKVAAPLKDGMSPPVLAGSPPIRNWKVAAPLKGKDQKLVAVRSTSNPQLKSCGSIEGYLD